jgi:predicted  nucleic acid-binding Zn ribbon protein
MKQLIMLIVPLVILNLGCSSTETKNDLAIPVKVVHKPNLYLSSSSTNLVQTTANSLTCDSLLDECAVVVEKQKKAISEQQKTISMLEEQNVQQKQEIQDEQKSSALYKGIAIGETVAILLLKLIGL